MTSNELKLIPTRAALAKKSASKEFQSTIFESHKSKQKLSKTKTSTDKQQHNLSANIFDIKRAKHEVFKFGASGLESKDKQVAKIALAIKLGAKPPKNVFKNYKDLLAEKKVMQTKEAEEKALWNVGKNAQGGASVTFKHMNNAKRKKKLNATITTQYGVVNPKIVKNRKKK